MSKMIQLRNVPDALHRKLKARAAEEGMSLSDYLIAEISAIANRATKAEMMYRLSQQEPVDLGQPAAEIIRAARGEL